MWSVRSSRFLIRTHALDIPSLHKKWAGTMTSIMKNDQELFRQFVDNDGFKRWLTNVVYDVASSEVLAAEGFVAGEARA